MGTATAPTPNQSLNLHDFRWDHALYAGRRIYGDDFPKLVSVFLIEAASLKLGLEMSREVVLAADNVEGRVRELIAKWCVQ